MGLLSLGTPLDWHQSKAHNEHVRANGISQLVNVFAQHISRDNDRFFWGDEVEYMLVDIDHIGHKAKLAIDHDGILTEFAGDTKAAELARLNNVGFHPEYGRYMIEATPGSPYDGDSLADYLAVENNMIARRLVAQTQLPAHIRPLTLTAFPRMGCANFTSPQAKAIGPASQSLFLPDEIINRHARFPTLTANIRKRRGCKVAINLPLYPDSATKLLDDSIPDRELFDSDGEPKLGASIPGHVYLDSMGFGMGSSCLQMTMQAENIGEARYLYDSLAPITPIFLALSAAAPIFKGFLVDQDVRWNVISGAVDDRTFIERDVDSYPGYDFFGGLDVDDDIKKRFDLLGGGKGINGDNICNEFGDLSVKTKDGKPIQKIPKSRYSSIDNYLVNNDIVDEKFNDIYSPINQLVYNRLLKEPHFDKILAKHFGHLFIRDPLVVFSERIHQDNTRETDHFENLQSTNWQTLRFKPPSLYSSNEELVDKPGWRVEFRPTEIQLSDFENAAYTVFIILLSKAILKFRPNFYIPILKIDENMDTAHKVDAVTQEKFWFKNFESWDLPIDQFIGYDISWFDRFINQGNDYQAYINGYLQEPLANDDFSHITHTYCQDNNCKYHINDIINGTSKFPGLIKLIIKYIATELVPKSAHHCDSDKLAQKLLRLQHYLILISKRASGKIPTIAHWLRDNVTKDTDLYHHDSKVSDDMNYKLIKLSQAITDLDFTNHHDLLYNYFGRSLGSYLESQKELDCTSSSSSSTL